MLLQPTKNNHLQQVKLLTKQVPKHLLHNLCHKNNYVQLCNKKQYCNHTKHDSDLQIQIKH